jgi:PhnB protein
MAKHTPYILSEDAKAQAEFYTQALGGEILSEMTYGQLPESDDAIKDKVVHLSLVAGGVTIFMSDSFEPVRYGNGMNFSLEFATEDEAREAFAKLAEGGKVKYPLAPAFWGALHGQLEDKFGMQWMITNEVKTN